MQKLYIFLMGILMAATIHAQPYKIYVPYPAGGQMDALARLISKELTKQGTENVVINKPGGGSAVALNEMLSKKSDPYQILLSSIGVTSIAAIQSEDFNDKAKNLQVLAPITTTYGVIVAHPKTGIKTFPQLMSALKNQTINFGTSGVQNQLFLQQVFGKIPNANLINYPGDANMLPQLLGGQLDVGFLNNNIKLVQDSIANSALIPLAQTFPNTIDNIPSITQFGIRDYEYAPIWTIYNLKDVPPQISANITKQILSVVDNPEITEFLTQLNLFKLPKNEMKNGEELQSRVTAKFQKLMSTK